MCENHRLTGDAVGESAEIHRMTPLPFLVALLLVAPPFSSGVAPNDEPVPIFDGVTTEFTLTRSRIRKDQPLEVRVTIRNTTDTVKVFRC
jgi:hypothetical protein